MKENIQKLIKKSSNPKLIEDALSFAKEAYKDKNRLSGENYIHHAIRVALMLDEMGLDETTVVFGLLHDAIDDASRATIKNEVKTIERQFGPEIGRLIERISELGRIRYSLKIDLINNKSLNKEKIENLRRMFLAIAGDLRVVLVELVSRIDGLNFLSFLPEDQRKLYAFETLQIFVPIANRLGLSEIRRKLEDTSFSYLFPERFKWLKENIKGQYEEREKYLKKFISQISKIFKKERVEIQEINYRTKSYWSTYKKLLTHNMDFNRIHDLLALRIITKNIESCYKILGIIHKHYKPISGEINDYIAKPKKNGYRSLHTTVFSKDEKITEIQIRTKEMHNEAEYGVCAHWSYKEKVNLLKEGENFEWMKDAQNFWNSFKINFFENQVFTFTPRGDVIVLPKGACPIDFAYAVHSEIGNSCESAKINNKIVPLNQTLENGDIVEITTNKKKKPSKDWLRFVKTSFARSHIKKLTEEPTSIFKIAIPAFIQRKINEITERAKKKKEEKALVKKEGPKQIFIAGQKGMLVKTAKCCNPAPGEKVKAYISKNRAAVLHRTSCPIFKKIVEKFPDKIIDASWG